MRSVVSPIAMSRSVVRRTLGACAGVLGVLAAVAGRSSSPSASIDVAALAGEIERQTDHVDAIELARWIRDRKPGLRVIDVRSDSEFAAYHIPSAEHVPLSDVPRMRRDDSETLVLYSEGGAHAGQAWVLLRALGHRRVYFLRGGVLDWIDDVLNAAVGTGPDAERVAALSRYFGGTPHVAAPNDSLVPAPHAAAQAVARMRRRGC
jgi:rhodanese-related sulfurtransferase